MERFNNDLVIRYLDRVVVKDDGYEDLQLRGFTCILMIGLINGNRDYRIQKEVT